ncbi:MAG: bifunctional phosphoribosylaminoimidazolecarboxamide formyltransferase/IMP cyclohydrolase [Coriobacteriales bacterium]|jgi:phosphoribosylaminoimidazolecarboxamide formyltransferase/IMP cyclohydrolase|nr:bifunctional phosphoribosylaminoimidazolecarboxamide formyltransferase/IMP cyclohydrolase [Coriobacteriales bacterium]
MSDALNKTEYNLRSDACANPDSGLNSDACANPDSGLKSDACANTDSDLKSDACANLDSGLKLDLDTKTKSDLKSEPIIKRALLSVTNKSGIVNFAKALHEQFAVELVSTGGTAKVLIDAGLPVKTIDELTGFPEMMDGRVKTLHPRVHGGLLARRDLQEHMQQASEHGIGMIDMVVVNLYAFEATIARADVTYELAIENIDIGGPSMLRSAAKNHASVAVVTAPESYASIIAEMHELGGCLSYATRQSLALEVFKLTSAYDNAIYSWLATQGSDSQNGGYVQKGDDAQKGDDSQRDSFANSFANSFTNSFANDKRLFLRKSANLRYGENPHQQAAFYVGSSTDCGKQNSEYLLANAKQLQGKELSYNNYLDLDAAWAAVREFCSANDKPAAVIVKHLTPCGIALDSSITAAYQKAHDCDPVSAFGGVMAFNRTVTTELVQAIFNNGQFIEAMVAPEYEDGALELLKQKPSARILVTGGINPAGASLEYRSIEGGILAMTADSVNENPAEFSFPTDVKPTPEQFDELLFAWRACKSVKSNAILIAKDYASIGIGAGQPNRVNSAELAIKQAGDLAQGAVAASDAFMPFADSLKVLTDGGVVAVIQPGGSVRDEEVIAAANEAGIALVFTGHRHFRH